MIGAVAPAVLQRLDFTVSAIPRSHFGYSVSSTFRCSLRNDSYEISVSYPYGTFLAVIAPVVGVFPALSRSAQHLPITRNAPTVRNTPRRWGGCYVQQFKRPPFWVAQNHYNRFLLFSFSILPVVFPLPVETLRRLQTLY